jgi:hypothetical protein
LESAGTASPQGVPTPAGGVVSGQPPSNGVVTFTAEQIAALEPMIEKRVQSMKDRRIAELENAVNELRSGYPVQASIQPVPPSQVQPASLANGAPQAASQAVDFLSIYSAVGVDPNSNDVIQLTRQHGNNPDALELALIRYQRAKANQPPAPASAIPAPSGSVGSAGNLDSKIARLAELQRTPRLNKAEQETLIREIDSLGAFK